MNALISQKKWRRSFQAVNGRPLATFCASYLAGAAAGVTFSPLPVIHGCILSTAVGWLLWHWRVLSTTVLLLGIAGIWLGVAQGVRYARRDEALWLALPRDVAAITEGVVLTEPVRRAGAWRFVFGAESLTTEGGTLRAPVRLWVYVPETLCANLYAGERLRLEGRLRMPSNMPGNPDASFARYLRRQGISRTMRPYRLQRVPQPRWNTVLSRARRTLILHLRRHLPAQEGNLAAAVVLNDRTGLSDQMREDFRRTGTVHILSPSGTHVSILAVAVWWACQFARVPRRVAALAVIATVWLFAGVAAGGEPAFRAAVMGTLVAGAAALQREGDLPTSLALAGFLIVLADIGALRDPSFQFSFTLVAAMVASAGWLRAIASGGRLRLLRALLAAFCLSLVCAVASAPLTALYYRQISLVAPVANLIIAVPVQLLTSAGLVLACLPRLPDVLVAPVALSAWLVERSIRMLATPKWVSVGVSAPSMWGIAVFYALFFVAMLVLSARADRRRRELMW